MTEIAHSPERRRFVTEVDGYEAYVEYEVEGGAMIITHTIVPAPIGGRGIAAALVRTAVEHARQEGLKVVPACSYAAAWFARHPEYADLEA